ncbi:MAG: hypothetical protein V4722_00700 [Bacteroidota bacterium]
MNTKNHVSDKRQKKMFLDGAISLIFIISICFGIMSVAIYRMTIIPGKYLFVAGCLGTLIVFAILLFLPGFTYSKFLTLILAIVIGSCVSNFGLLIINKTFSDPEINSENFQILSTGNRTTRNSTCARPFAVVDFHGQSKELLFACDYEKK